MTVSYDGSGYSGYQKQGGFRTIQSELERAITEINNNKPFFRKEDFEIVEGIPQYSKPDVFNRAGGGIAIISKYTLSIMIEKHLKYPDPNGWTEKINNTKIFQRCHAIAYRNYI